MKIKNTLKLIITLIGISLGSHLMADPGSAKESHRQKILKQFDVDGDGQLSEEERIAAREAKAKGKQTKKRHKFKKETLLKKFDADGDGELSESEKEEAKAFRAAKKAEILAEFDADGDGKLTGEERKAARQARMEKRKENREDKDSSETAIE